MNVHWAAGTETLVPAARDLSDGGSRRIAALRDGVRGPVKRAGSGRLAPPPSPMGRRWRGAPDEGFAPSYSSAVPSSLPFSRWEKGSRQAAQGRLDLFAKPFRKARYLRTPADPAGRRPFQFRLARASRPAAAGRIGRLVGHEDVNGAFCRHVNPCRGLTWRSIVAMTCRHDC